MADEKTLKKLIDAMKPWHGCWRLWNEDGQFLRFTSLPEQALTLLEAELARPASTPAIPASGDVAEAVEYYRDIRKAWDALEYPPEVLARMDTLLTAATSSHEYLKSAVHSQQLCIAAITDKKLLETENTALREALASLYDKWENGVPCFSDWDGSEGSDNIGNAFNLTYEEEKEIIDLLPKERKALSTYRGKEASDG